MKRLLVASLVFLFGINATLAATVAGTVVSSAAGDPLLDVQMLVNGEVATTTDLKGGFQVEAKAGDVIRAVKPDYVGIAAVTIGGDETLTFTLAPVWPLTSLAQVYTDITTDSWYAAAVQALYEQQIFAIAKAQPYRPGDPLTRAELSNFAVLAAGFLPPVIRQTNFCDMEADAWYAPAVEFMYAQEWIGGYNTLLCDKGKDFRPGSPVTRAEAVKMVLGVFGDLVQSRLKQTECFPIEFTDVAETDWFAPFVADAACLGIVGGYADGTFRPGNSVNRAEIAVILSNTLEALRNN